MCLYINCFARIKPYTVAPISLLSKDIPAKYFQPLVQARDTRFCFLLGHLPNLISVFPLERRFTAMKFVIILGLVSSFVAAGKIDPQILENIKSTGSSDVLVSFKNSKLAQVRSQFIETHKLSDRSIRLNSFYLTLKNHADQTQSKFLSSLDKLNSSNSVEIRELWITNQLIIRKASEEIIRLLRDSNEISNVQADRIIPLLTPTFSRQPGKSCNSTSSEGIPWGISRIEASKVWADGFRGQGVVVSNVDTGVQYNHEALKENYRAEYGWFDPYEGTTIPNDPQGHGTHTMGTLVGRAKVIGVAPEAKWIACKGCSTSGCSTNALLLCGQWTTYPSNPDGEKNCSMASLVSSNSWGSRSGDPWYEEILDAYVAVGIHAVFSIGNRGSSCESTGYPGEQSLKMLMQEG